MADALVRHLLRCVRCAAQVPARSVDYRCGRCGGEVRVEYPSGPERSELTSGSLRRGLWRHLHRLPVSDPTAVVSLGEGDTPLLPLSRVLTRVTGVRSVAAKAEHRNPTGSFKDRIASVAVTIAVERGLPGCLGTSSGNGGAALAAYAAAGGRRALLFVRADIVPAKLREIRGYGAETTLLDPGRDDGATLREKADELAGLGARHGFLPFITAFRYSPEAMEGAATIAYELAEAAPDTTDVYLPVGGGGLLAALRRGYLRIRGSLPDGPPRLIGAQPVGCATLRRALVGDLAGLTEPMATSVSGLQMPMLFDGYEAAAAVRDSGGHVVEIADEQAWAAQRLLARQEGLLVEPAGATAVAGLLADAEAGRLRPDSRVVVLLTGAGYKDGAALARLAGDETLTSTEVAGLAAVLAAAAGAGTRTVDGGSLAWPSSG